MKKLGIACDHAGYEMKEFWWVTWPPKVMR